MQLQNAARKEESGYASSVVKEFLAHVRDGLRKPQKQLSPKYFYDEKGSGYFDKICQLEEYYPYKSELKLMPIVARDISRILTDRYSVVEFGAGSLTKVRPLLDWLRKIDQFVPIDISGEHLRSACEELSGDYPGVNITPIEADFSHEVDLSGVNAKRLGFFPGSTIGNFTPAQAKSFLGSAGKTLGPDSYFIIGVDTKKSPTFLHHAYNDAQGITAKFNLNMLHRINNDLKCDIPVHYFEHYAHYNALKGCVEMHLVSTKNFECNIAGESIHFSAGESIHTENSYKYHPEEFTALAEKAGWSTQKIWMAERDMFSIFLLKY